MNELKTCFKRVEYDLSGLLHYIEIGDIGLPDIQRPFVWKNAKVRDLFDSMYRGFPVGYLLFWENDDASGARQIGTGSKQRNVAARLIIDCQQRLTSLYAVFRGRKGLDADYREKHIEIALRPRDARFEVADAAIRRDPERIANVSEMWSSGKSSRKLVNDFIHLFPRAWLEKHVTQEQRQINQVANYALLEWPDNLNISDAPPSQYVPVVRQRFDDHAEWDAMCDAHALPRGWDGLSGFSCRAETLDG